MNTKHHHFVPFHFHHHHWNMDIMEFYTFEFLYEIANTTMSLFVPIFLFSIGYDLDEILMFFLINQAFFLIFSPFSGYVTNKLGVKKTMILHLPALAIYMYMLSFLSGSFSADLGILFFILFLRASTRSFYNVALDIFFTKHILKKAKGKMLSWLKIIMVMGGIVAPFFGGIITYFFGFDKLFFGSCGLLLLSIVPLLLTPDKHFPLHYTARELWDFTLHKSDKAYVLAEIGKQVPGMVMWIIWPVFLYFVFENTVDLGMLISVSAFFSIVISYFLGKKIDTEKNPKKILENGVRGITGLFFFRAIFLNPIIITIIDALQKIIDPIVEIPYNYYAYRMVQSSSDQIEMANIKQFISEIICTFAIILIWGITIFFSEPNKYFFVVLFASFSFFLLFMRKVTNIAEEKEKK